MKGIFGKEIKMFSKKILSGLLFVISFTILWYTSYPSIGWWNSGYNAACAYKLGIPLSGRSILFVLLGRVFTVLFFFLSTIKAITMVSIISSSLASVLFFHTLLSILDHIDDKNRVLNQSVSFLTASSLAFLYSIWVESYVTRVYSLGLFLTSVLFLCATKIWLSDDEKQKVKPFLLIVFIMGIDFGAHQLNLPFILVIIVLLIFRLRKHFFRFKFWASLIVVLAAGLSIHLYLLIRGQQHPSVDLGYTQTFSQLIAWIKMKIYGGRPSFLDLFHRKAPLWDYQIKYMYLRYFGWNFLGTRVSPAIFVSIIPFILGGIGFAFSLVKKFKIWIFIFLSFATYSIILIFYLNVVQGFHNMREIDRLFLPSFFMFLFWIGIGLYFLFCRILKPFPINDSGKKTASALLFMIGFTILPLNIVISNWTDCNKNKYFFPEDFAYNLLNSCEKDAILFTNGDNDTFPLLYLQNVEEVRTDITVINVNLLNVKSYLDQLVSGQNFPVDSTITKTERLHATRIKNPVEIKIASPTFPVNNYLTDDTLKVLYAGHQFGNNYLLLVQDRVMISFLKENKWKRSVYFSSTVAPSNLLGLKEYLSTAGIVRKLLPIKNVKILPQELESNLLTVYKFRSFNDQSVRLEKSVILLYNNFRFAFVSLAEYYLSIGNRQKAIEIFRTMKQVLPDWRFSKDQSVFVEEFEQKLKI